MLHMHLTPLERKAFDRGDMPPPSSRIWKRGAFAATFGDAFVEGTDLEGGLIAPSLKVMSDTLHRVVARGTDMELDDKTTSAILCFASKCARGAGFDKVRSVGCRIFRTLLTAFCMLLAQWDRFEIPEYLERLHGYLESLKPGDYAVLPGGWRTGAGGHAIINVVERNADGSARFTVCNSGQGLGYHPQSTKSYPSMAALGSMSLDNIPWSRVVDPGFLFSLVNLFTNNRSHESVGYFYDVLMPHLAGEPLNTAVARTEQVQDWDTPQRAGTCFYRCCLVALRYCLRRAGLTKVQVKSTKLAMRVEFMRWALFDLRRGGDVEEEDQEAMEEWRRGLLDMSGDGSGPRTSRTALRLERLGVLPPLRDAKGGQEGEEGGGAAETKEDDAAPDVPAPVPGLEVPHTLDTLPALPEAEPVEGPLLLPESQLIMLGIACQQTAHAALKHREREGGLDEAGLQRITAVIEDVKAAMTSDNVKVVGTSDALPPKLDLRTVATAFQPFGNMDLLANTEDASRFAGKSKGELPDPYVDLCEGAPPLYTPAGRPVPGQWGDMMALMRRVLQRCHKLEQKASVTSARTSAHQRLALVQHVILHRMPVPVAWTAERAAADPADVADAWTPEELSLEDQRGMLVFLFRLMAYLVSSMKSVSYERLMAGAHLICCAKVTAIIQHVACLVPNVDRPAGADAEACMAQASPVTQLMVGCGPAAAFLQEVYGEAEAAATAGQAKGGLVREAVEYHETKPGAAEGALESKGDGEASASAKAASSSGAAGEGADGDADAEGEKEEEEGEDAVAAGREAAAAAIGALATRESVAIKGTLPPVAPVHVLGFVSAAQFDLAGMTDTCLVTEPAAAVARGDLIRYFRDTEKGQVVRLFHYNTVLAITEDDPVFLFSRALALALGKRWSKPFGRYRIPKTALERTMMWFTAGFDQMPEFDILRDMGLLVKLVTFPDPSRRLFGGEFTSSTCTPQWHDYFDMMPLPGGKWAAVIRVSCLSRSNMPPFPIPPHTLDMSTVCAFVEGVEKRVKGKYAGPVDTTNMNWDYPLATAETVRQAKEAASRTSPGTQLHRLVSEEDILHVKRLPFDGVLSRQECEELMCLLTAPYVRIPLVLNFFANNRLGALFDPSIRRLIERILFEPLAYAPEEASAAGAAAGEAPPLEDALKTTTISTVPLREDIDGNVVLPDGAGSKRQTTTAANTFSAFGTRYGLLANELQAHPGNVVRPIIELAQQVDDNCTGSFTSSFVTLLVYILRLAVDVEGFLVFVCKHADAMPLGTASTAEAKHWLRQLRLITRGVLLKRLEGYISEAEECVASEDSGSGQKSGSVPLPPSGGGKRPGGRGGPGSTNRALLALSRLHAHRALVFKHGGFNPDADEVAVPLSAPEALQLLSSIAQCNAWTTTSSSPLIEKALSKTAKLDSGRGGPSHRGNRAGSTAPVFKKGTREAAYPERDGLTYWVPMAAVAAVLQAQREAAIHALQSAALPSISTASRQLNASLNAIVACAAGKAASTSMLWKPVFKTDLRCKRVIETPHPCSNSGTQLWHVHFPGSKRIVLSVDSKSRMGQGHLTFFKDANCNSHWGREKVSDNYGSGGNGFYGVGGTPPLIIPTDEFYVGYITPPEPTRPLHLAKKEESQAGYSTQYEKVWGFKLTIEASVDASTAVELSKEPIPEGAGTAGDAGRTWPLGWAYDALARAGNVKAEAVRLLGERLASEPLPREGQVDSAGSGLFSNPNGMELNLQTCEVYQGGRQLLPTPQTVRSSEEYKAVFKSENPLCGVHEIRGQCSTYSLDSGKHTYFMTEWKTAQAPTHELVRSGPDIAPAIDKLSAPESEAGAAMQRASSQSVLHGLEVINLHHSSRMSAPTFGTADEDEAGSFLRNLPDLPAESEDALRAAVSARTSADEERYRVSKTPVDALDVSTMKELQQDAAVTDSEVYYGCPRVVEGVLQWQGEAYSEAYRRQSCGWVSDVLEKCEDLPDTMKGDAWVSLVIRHPAGLAEKVKAHYETFDASSQSGSVSLPGARDEDEVLGRMLLTKTLSSDYHYDYRSETGDDEGGTSTGPPDFWMEIQIMRYRKEVRIFVLRELARRATRSFVFSTDGRYANKFYLSTLLNARAFPWLKNARFASCNSSESYADRHYYGGSPDVVITRRLQASRDAEEGDDGDSTQEDDDDAASGAGNSDSEDEGAGSSGASSDPSSLAMSILASQEETFLPPTVLSSLLPNGICSQYDFWLSGKPSGFRDVVSFRGYPRTSRAGRTFLELDLKRVPRLSDGKETLQWEAWVRRFTLAASTHRRTTSGAAAGDGDSEPTIRIAKIELLLDASRAAVGSTLEKIASVMLRMEGLSDTLFWSELPVPSEDAWTFKQPDGTLAVPPCEVQPGADVAVSKVEVLSLGCSFTPKGASAWLQSRRAETLGDHASGVRLMSDDFDGLYVSDARSSELARHLHGMPFAIVLENEQLEQFIMAPNYPVVNTKVSRGSPFSTEITATRDPDWQRSVNTRYYLYALHRSGAFLTCPSVGAAFYLVRLAMYARDYRRASELLRAAYKDSSMTGEEQFMFNALLQCSGDQHPDAHALRLHCALIGNASGIFDSLKEVRLIGSKQGHRNVGRNVRGSGAREWQRVIENDLGSYMAKEDHVGFYATLTPVQLQELGRAACLSGAALIPYLAAAVDCGPSQSADVVPPPPSGSLRLERLPSRLAATDEGGQLVRLYKAVSSSSMCMGTAGLVKPHLPKPGRYYMHVAFAKAKHMELTASKASELPPGATLKFFLDAEFTKQVGPEYSGSAMVVDKETNPNLKGRMQFSEHSWRQGQRVVFKPNWSGVKGERPVTLFTDSVYVVMDYLPEGCDKDAVLAGDPIDASAQADSTAQHFTGVVQAGLKAIDTSEIQRGDEDLPYTFDLRFTAVAPVSAVPWGPSVETGMAELKALRERHAQDTTEAGKGSPLPSVSWWRDEDMILKDPDGHYVKLDLIAQAEESITDSNLFAMLHSCLSTLRPRADGVFLSELHHVLPFPGDFSSGQRDWTPTVTNALSDATYLGQAYIGFFLPLYCMLVGQHRLDIFRETETETERRKEEVTRKAAAAAAEKWDMEEAERRKRAAEASTEGDSGAQTEDAAEAAESALGGGAAVAVMEDTTPQPSRAREAAIEAAVTAAQEELGAEMLHEMRQFGNPAPGTATLVKLMAASMMDALERSNMHSHNSTLASLQDRRMAVAILLLFAVAAEHDAQYGDAVKLTAALPELPLSHAAAVRMVYEDAGVLKPTTAAGIALREELDRKIEMVKASRPALASARTLRHLKNPFRRGRVKSSQSHNRRGDEGVLKQTDDIFQRVFEKKLFRAAAMIASSSYLRFKYLREPTPMYVMIEGALSHHVRIQPRHIHPQKQPKASNYQRRAFSLPTTDVSREVVETLSQPLSDCAAFVEAESEAAAVASEAASAALSLDSLPFEVRHLSVAHSHSGQQFLERMEGDLQRSRGKSSAAATLKALTSATVGHMKAALSSALSQGSLADLDADSLRALGPQATEVVAGLAEFSRHLHGVLHSSQAATWAEAERLYTDANSENVAGTPSTSDAVMFRARRLSGVQPIASLLHVMGSVLSTAGEADLQDCNSFIGPDESDSLFERAALLMMQSVRASQAASAMMEVTGLLKKLQGCFVEALQSLLVQPHPGSASATTALLPSGAELAALYRTGFDFVQAHALCMQAANAVLSAVDTLAAAASVSSEDALQALHLHMAVGTFMLDFDTDKLLQDVASGAVQKLLDCLPSVRAGCCVEGQAVQAHVHREEPSVVSERRVAVTLDTLSSSSAAAARRLRQQRHFLEQSDSAIAFDPRFLAFEFVLGLVLRKRQVELVEDFYAAAMAGKSSVHQMLMGMGKTSVISPLLVLMLADGQSLVTQVVPDALLHQTQDVLRARFSSIMQIQISTLAFERSDPALDTVDKLEGLLDRVNRVRLDGGVMVTTPASLKSMMLQYLDYLQSVQASQKMLEVSPGDPAVEGKLKLFMNARTSRSKELKADVLRDIMRMWGPATRGRLLMDEVDLILNPLKSELNFPIGAKVPLDFSPWRWEFAMHLMDAVFYASGEKLTPGATGHDMPITITAEGILDKLRACVDEGTRQLAIQRKPHLLILQEDFFNTHLRPLMAQWSAVWFNYHADEFHTPGAPVAEADSAAFMMCDFTVPEGLAERVVAGCTPMGMQALNLIRDWMNSLLFFCLSKVHRVSFGVLQQRDMHRLRTQHTSSSTTPSRMLNAVPFVGKDSPSPASEFAHPDVLVGLTVLSFRYSGLRGSDVAKLVTQLKKDLSSEPGPFESRKSYQLFAKWTSLAAESASAGNSAEVLPLHLAQPADLSQLSGMTAAISKIPQAILYFLRVKVFPDTMQHQQMKLTASGVDLGSDMLFHTRLGFSGTPSDLLPIGLPSCHYELGSDAAMVRQLVREDVVTPLCLPSDWSVKSVLKMVATCTAPEYNALIDTGAVVTGLSNLAVAKFLLKHGLDSKQGCVYLNSKDEKMVFLRDMATSVPLSQCGLAKEKLFVFFDQVHTTGMDIPQAVNARACVTLGKDMTLRDYAQGCWRMRGLGKGQTLTVALTPEVVELVHGVTPALEDGRMPGDFGMPAAILAFLVSNSMRAEQLQHVALVEQNLSYTWRKPAFVDLLNSASPDDENAGLVAQPDALRLLLDAGAAGTTKRRRLKEDKKMDVEAEMLDQTTYALGYAADLMEEAADDAIVDAGADSHRKVDVTAADKLATFDAFVLSRYGHERKAEQPMGTGMPLHPPGMGGGAAGGGTLSAPGFTPGLSRAQSMGGAAGDSDLPPPPAPAMAPLVRAASLGSPTPAGGGATPSLEEDLKPGSLHPHWLSMCVKAFRDPLNLHLASDVQQPKGFTATLLEKKERRHLFIAHTPGAEEAAAHMLVLAAKTTGLASSDGVAASDADGAQLTPEQETAALAVRRALQGVQVLEIEKMKDEEKEKQKQQEKEIARLLDADLGLELPFRVIDFLVHPARHREVGRGRTFYPLRELELGGGLEGAEEGDAPATKHSLAFPSSVWVSENHTNETSFSRCRLKNGGLALVWRLPASPLSEEQYLALNSVEEERQAQKEGVNKHEFADGREDVLAARAKAAREAADKAPSVPAPAEAPVDLSQTEFLAQVTLAEAETLRRAVHTRHPALSQAASGSAATVAVVAVDGWGLDWAPSDTAPDDAGEPLQVAEQAATGQVSAVPDSLQVGASALQFYNCNVWYSVQDLADQLLQWTAECSPEELAGFFTQCAALRTRDRRAFSGTVLEPIMAKKPKDDLVAASKLVKQATAALIAAHGSVAGAVLSMVGDASETVKRSVVLGAVQSEIDASGLDEAATLSVLWGANEVELAPALVTAHLLHLSAPRSRLFRAVLCAASGKPMAKEIAGLHADELTKLSADMPAEADLSLANAEVGDEVVGSVDAAAALEAAKHARTVRRADATCGKYLPPDQPWVLHSGDSVFISSEGFVSSDPAADNGDSKQAHVAQPATAVVGHSPLYSGAHYYECVLSQNGHEVLHTLREVHLEVTRARRLALQDAKSKKEAQEGTPSGTPIGGDAKQADGDSAAGVEDGRIFTGRQQRAGGWKDEPKKPEPSSTGVGWLANEDQLLVLRGDGKVAFGDEILADAGRALKLGDVVGVTADLGKGQVVFYLNHKSVACVALADIEGLAGSADAPVGLRPAVRVNAHAAWHVFLGSKGWSEATTALLMAESGYLSAAPAFKASLFSVFMSAQQTIPGFANVLESKAGEEEEVGSGVLPTNHAPVSATLQWREEMQELLRSGARAGKLVELRDRSVIKEYTAETSSTDYSYYCTLAGLTFSSGKYLFEFSFDKGAQGALGFRTAPFRFSANQQKGLHDNAAFGIDGMTPSCSNHWMGELFVKRGMAHQGERWKTDVTYSIAVDMDVGTVWYGVDGKWTLPNGPAYRHIREVAASGLNMAVHLYASSRCKINVGQSPFKCDAPQPGFQPLLAWFSERLELLNKVKESAASTEGAPAAEAAQ